MSEYEQKDNDGVLFVNEKRSGDSSPHWRGKACVNGEMVWLAAWKNESAAGKPYLKLAFTPMEEEASAPARSGPMSQPAEEEIPW